MNNPADQLRTCVNCGRDRPATQVDTRGWCQGCRAQLLRRSRFVARLVGFVFTLALATLIYSRTSGDSGFLLGYVVLIVATYFLVVRITQRVTFEVFRSRGVPPQPGR